MVAGRKIDIPAVLCAALLPSFLILVLVSHCAFLSLKMFEERCSCDEQPVATMVGESQKVEERPVLLSADLAVLRFPQLEQHIFV